MRAAFGNLISAARPATISARDQEWPQGVGIYGLFPAWEFSGDPRHQTLLEGW
jgi:rhamnogalacturonyl hydrolase YesR